MENANVIVVSQIKNLAKFNETELSVSKDFYEELNNRVLEMIHKACERAVLNKRTTVMGRDV